MVASAAAPALLNELDLLMQIENFWRRRVVGSCRVGRHRGVGEGNEVWNVDAVDGGRR